MFRKLLVKCTIFRSFMIFLKSWKISILAYFWPMMDPSKNGVITLISRLNTFINEWVVQLVARWHFNITKIELVPKMHRGRTNTETAPKKINSFCQLPEFRTLLMIQRQRLVLIYWPVSYQTAFLTTRIGQNVLPSKETPDINMNYSEK